MKYLNQLHKTIEKYQREENKRWIAKRGLEAGGQGQSGICGVLGNGEGIFFLFDKSNDREYRNNDHNQKQSDLCNHCDAGFQRRSENRENNNNNILKYMH